MQPEWIHDSATAGVSCMMNDDFFETIIAAIAQLAARRSHNPKVVSSILTRRMSELVPGKSHRESLSLTELAR